MADNLKTTLKSVSFNSLNEVYFIIDSLPILIKALACPHTSQDFGMSATEADYRFIHSVGSDFAFCCDKLTRILNLILPNFEFVVNALP